MKQPLLIKPTPWDTAAFCMPTWELLEYSEAALKESAKIRGHYTIKVNPLTDKRLLHENEFYYCDTLTEPYCDVARLRPVYHPDASISKTIDRNLVLSLCHGAFTHGRFHRDFNLTRATADHRYDNWLAQLIDQQQVYGLYWQERLAGFIGYNGNSLVLHALAEEYRGKSLSKYWWSTVCCELLDSGHREIKSSISASNVAVFNLYASLGFCFKNPVDIYHRFVD